MTGSESLSSFLGVHVLWKHTRKLFFEMIMLLSTMRMTSGHMSKFRLGSLSGRKVCSVRPRGDYIIVINDASQIALSSAVCCKLFCKRLKLRGLHRLTDSRDL